jgi:hypothetical protein
MFPESYMSEIEDYGINKLLAEYPDVKSPLRVSFSGPKHAMPIVSPPS